MEFEERFERWKRRVPGYIDNGVRFLDSIAYRWWDDVNLGELNMKDGTKCVFSQVTGMDYHVATGNYGIDFRDDQYGFTLGLGYFEPHSLSYLRPDDRRKMYEYLTEQWIVRVLQLRRERPQHITL